MRILIICIFLISSQAYAGKNYKVHSTDSVAMGYTGITIYSPSSKVLDNNFNSFHAISIDLRGSVSELIKVKNWIEDIVDFSDKLNSISVAIDNVDELYRIIGNGNGNLSGSVLLDLLRFSFITSKLGYISVGGYSESAFGMDVFKLNTSNIKWDLDHIDIGKDFTEIRAKGWNDDGITFEYGRQIKFSNNMRLGLGIAHHIFHRLDFTERKVIFKKEIYNNDDIIIPDFSYKRGWGFGSDFFTTFDFGDRFIGARTTIEVRNAPCVIWMNNTERDMTIVGMGVSAKPLLWSGLESLLVALDFQFNNGSSFYSGASWKFGGNRFSFIPSVGGVLIGHDIWGESYRSFTTGFTSKILIFELTGAFEYMIDKYNAGVRLSLGW